MNTTHQYELDLAGSGTFASIDAAPDNGFLNCSARAYPNHARHSTTQEAINNFVGRLSLGVDTEVEAGAKSPVLVGHGNEGLLITGEGQTASDVAKFIMGWNEYNWGPEFNRLQPKQFPIFTILSCHTGAGSSGADLLFAIAKRIGKAVQARTGFTYCGNGRITFEPNSVWQVATPSVRPNPIEAPPPHFSVEMDDIIISVNRHELSISENSEVELSYALPDTEDAESRKSKSIVGNNAVGTLRLVDWKGKFEIDGSPAAMPTLKFSLNVKSPDGKQTKSSYTLWNDRLLQEDGTNFFFYVSQGFSKAFK